MTPRGGTVVAAVAVVAGIAATCALGAWQVRRGAAKEVLLQQIEAAARAAPVMPTTDALHDPASLVHHHLRVDGRWRPDRVVYLDNRPLDGRVGFYVLMALAIDAPEPAEVIVNRGWVPRDANDRSRIASYVTPDEAVVVEGVALDEEPRLLELGTPVDRRLGGIWQNFDFDAYSGASGTVPLRVVVRQDAGAPTDGLTRDWPDRGGALQAQIDRHHGYAFQWFGLAGALAAFLVYRIVRVIRHGRHTRN